MKTAHSLPVFILVGVTTSVLSLSPVFAQGQSAEQAVVTAEQESLAINRLTAIPPRLGEDLSLKGIPGQTIQASVRVKNSSLNEVTVQSSVEDFIIGEDGEEPIPVTEETPNSWSLAQWMTITPPVNTIGPNESATINVLIEVPADARPGGRYAMIMHQPGAGEFSIGGAASGVSQKVGTLVYFVVEGTVHEQAFIRQTQVKPLSEFGPIPFSFQIENQSDIHISPKVSVEISNMLGQNSGEITLESKNIFPGTVRDFEAEWNKKWGFGRYSGKISASYGSTGKVVTQVFSFWIIPLKLILGVIVLFFAVIGTFIFIKKKMKRASDQKSQEIEMLKQKVEALQKDKTLPFRDDTM